MMLSKLCTVRHFRSLSSRATSQSFAPNTVHSCARCSNALQSEESLKTENGHCRLVHCSFCDYNVCCLVGSYQPGANTGSSDNENTTDNPAYGLSSKEWLECKDMEIPCCKLNSARRRDCDSSSALIKKSSSGQPNLATASSCLESIPESREDCIASITSAMEHESRKNDLYSFSDSDIPAHSTLYYLGSLNSKYLGASSMNQDRKQLLEGSSICDIQCDTYLEELCCQPLKLNQLSNDTDEVKVINTRPKIGCHREKPLMPAFLPETQQRIGDKQPQHQQQHHHNHEPRSFQIYHPRARSDVAKLRNNMHLTKGKTHTLGSYRDSESRGNMSAKKRPGFLAEETLAEMTTVKTEESVQEWLSRISEWVESNSWIKDNCDDDDDDILGTKGILREGDHPQVSYPSKDDSRKEQKEQDATPDSSKKYDVCSSQDSAAMLQYTDDQLKDASASAKHALKHATKDSPAKVPMVVMQCSRLHSHITSKPPFQQSSLPMGTLVTALYQESDWLYVQTPHGVEGFVSSSNCIPIGTVRSQNQSKRPWEPCDFPIEMPMKNDGDFARQHTMFLPTKLPVRDSAKQLAPFVNVVKMKTCFYSDKYFSHTFKHRDSIKTAKTVRDILKSSPEIEIGNM